jgi:hypothetical protein
MTTTISDKDTIRIDEAHEGEDDHSPNADDAGEATSEEFHLVIKKLEMPVRPRGVLAE